ncbi:MAG: 3-oxoadipate enol-lactonase [Candidatus Azotimanducaceae bacterium]|jgi:3-oxoadipate enol-lactonase
MRVFGLKKSRKMPAIKANGISIYYETRGQGDPVLYIGGTGGDLRAKPNVLDSPLTSSFEVVAYDQRGLGQTDKPESEYTMADYADDAAALMDALGWQKAHVIGVSFGGMVALNLVQRHAHRINKLVLCCTSPGGSMPSFPFHELPSKMSTEARTKLLLGVNDTRRNAAWQAEHPDQVERIVQYTIDHAIAEHMTPEYRRGARRQIMARAQHDIEAQLADIAQETLICAGKYDGIAPLENQGVMAKAITNSELRCYEGGHLFLVQDRTAWRDIAQFVQKLPAH